MLYLKYRPQTISQLDNTEVREQLKKILTSGNLPHAFLFTGPKGTGKTSAARLVAKVVNAEVNAKEIKELNPSSDDENVAAITQGTSPDVIEMDAASHRKIDDIRDLISELKFAPLTSKYKVYIIDEVHMLTKEAFNALLKSLEEPPAHTIFILATTEADALPRTITSRCVTITFSHATVDDLTNMLERYQEGEDIEFPDEVNEYIAQHADGSFRDAAKILDLAIMNDAKTIEDVKKLLGQSWHKGDILELIASKDREKTIQWIEETARHGGNIKVLIESMLQTLHEELLRKNKIEVAGSKEYTFSIKEIALLVSKLQEAYRELKSSPVQALPLEVALVEYFGEVA